MDEIRVNQLRIWHIVHKKSHNLNISLLIPFFLRVSYVIEFMIVHITAFAGIELALVSSFFSLPKL